MTTKTPKKKTASNAPKLINFTMKAVIPTGAYANLQPEITVEAQTLQEAHEYVMPYIEHMYQTYTDYVVHSIQKKTQAVVTTTINNGLTAHAAIEKMNQAKTLDELSTIWATLGVAQKQPTVISHKETLKKQFAHEN